MEFDREQTKISRIIAIYIRIIYIIKYALTFRTITQIKYPVFIIGCGHTGTSILLSILGNHSKVYTVPNESYLFFENIKNIQKTLCLWIYQSKSSKKEVILEKTPSHVHCIESIRKIFPRSKFIFIIRDCRDTVLSLVKRGFELNESVRRWVNENSVIANHKYDPNTLEIKYESLVSDKENYFQIICKLIGVPFEKEILNNNNRTKSFYSHFQKIDSLPKESDHMERRNFQINQNLTDYSGNWKLKKNYYQVKQIMKDEHVLKLMIHFNYINKN